jgi:hypothetical protein
MNKLFRNCLKPHNTIISSKYIPEPVVVYAKTSNQKLLKDYIKKQLNFRNAQPLGISYCARVFVEPDFIGIQPNPKGQFTEKDKSQCVSHASIIIGKKKIGGVCHFLIRNSWAAPCNKYSWPCLENAAGENLGIWLSENALINNLKSITTLPDPEMKCTVKIKGISEDIAAMFPSAIFSSQGFDLKTHPFRFVVQFENNQPEFFINFRTPENTLSELKPAPEEGEEGNIYLREETFPEIGKVGVVCVKYPKKKKRIEEINMKKFFPKWKPKNTTPQK